MYIDDAEKKAESMCWSLGGRANQLEKNTYVKMNGV